MKYVLFDQDDEYNNNNINITTTTTTTNNNNDNETTKLLNNLPSLYYFPSLLPYKSIDCLKNIILLLLFILFIIIFGIILIYLLNITFYIYIEYISIPIISLLFTYFHIWMALWMTFYPIQFIGIIIIFLLLFIYI